MGAPMFLAMTADEIRDISPLPEKIAYLGSHFSLKKPELEGLPESLPPGCGLILDDRNPIPEIEPIHIVNQLSSFHPAFVLLDFQRPPKENSTKLAAAFSRLNCPVPMPPEFAKDLNVPVFLSPVPPHVPIQAHLEPWTHREIWLELALDAVQITVTAQGSRNTSFPHAEPPGNNHKDSMLHCHYKITQQPDALHFYCYRTREDIDALLRTPLPPNVTHTIGLFQELGQKERQSAD